MCVKSLKNWGQFPGNLVLATEFTHNLLLHGSQNMSSRYLFDKCKTQNSHSATQVMDSILFQHKKGYTIRKNHVVLPFNGY